MKKAGKRIVRKRTRNLKLRIRLAKKSHHKRSRRKKMGQTVRSLNYTNLK